jgi:hypothetical protein
MLSPTLYHFTCDHSAPLIEADGLLISQLQIDGPGRLVWMTDLPRPPRESMGLTSHILECDRMAWRFTVPPGQEVDWWPDWRRRVRPWWAEALESADMARPAHWWVAELPVAVDLPGVRYA